MIKILFTMIFSFSFAVFAQEAATPDAPSTNAAPISEKSASDFSGDQAYSKSAGVGKAPGKTEADLNPKDKSACTNCPQPTKERWTSKAGKLSYSDVANAKIGNKSKPVKNSDKPDEKK